MNTPHPQIPLEHALAVAGDGKKHGSQVLLAKALGLHKATINGWVRNKRKYLPPLHAHTFVHVYGQARAHP